MNTTTKRHYHYCDNPNHADDPGAPCDLGSKCTAMVTRKKTQGATTAYLRWETCDVCRDHSMDNTFVPQPGGTKPQAASLTRSDLDAETRKLTIHGRFLEVPAAAAKRGDHSMDNTFVPQSGGTKPHAA